MSTTEQERIVALEVKTDYQEQHLKNIDKEIEKLKSLSFIVEGLVKSTELTNDSVKKLTSTIENIEDRQDKLENAPKDAVYEVVTDTGKGIIKKVLPWILIAGLITGGVAICNVVTDKSTDTVTKVEKVLK